MRTYVKPGDAITYAHTSAVTPGQAVKIGLFLGVALGAYAANQAGAYAVKGVCNVNKLSTDVVAIGVALYWDNTNFRLTTTATGNISAGRAFSAAGSGVASVDIDLNVIGGTAVA